MLLLFHLPLLDGGGRILKAGSCIMAKLLCLHVVLRYKHDSAQSKKFANNTTIDTIACKSTLLQLVPVSGCAVNAQRCCSLLVCIEPSKTTIFQIHIQVYWRLCRTFEYNLQSNSIT